MEKVYNFNRMPAWANVFLLLSFPVVYLFIYAIYDLYFHPLSKFPGPKLWAISRIPYVRALQRGDFHRIILDTHKRYGPIVRLARNELSFTDAQAWSDIYSHHQKALNFPKNPIWMRPTVNGTYSILGANDEDHSRVRRLLAHGFSEKALRAQEPLLQSYVDLLIAQLRKRTSESVNHQANVDIVQWFNFTTFDIAGDLTFGESFHCLEEANYHPWVAILFLSFKAITLTTSCRLLPGFSTLLNWMMPKSIMQKRKDHFELATNRVHKRLEQGDNPQRPDFMTYVVRYNDEKGVTVPEIEATFSLLVIAGSETTATALSGMATYLLQSSQSLHTLTMEIRQSFKRESEITLDRVTKLPFLNAVIEEGLRLCPPVPSLLPRLVPTGGAIVCGNLIPGGTHVSIPQYATFRAPTNFSNPDTFIPTRWLNPPVSEDNTVPSATHLAGQTGQANPYSRQPIHNPRACQPFSTGPRNCIGKNLAFLTMRLVLAKLLWNFDIAADGDVEDWASQKTYILWEKRPLPVRLTVVGR
ncbi:hypothetical protein MMC19_003877 [Ptychographa xylographoides]|nr:hypothetical protein [Ptychographa xylographoides]